MWWEQTLAYIDLTYLKNLDELMDQGIETLEAQTKYHIKGDVIWAMGPKAKNEIRRCQRGRELKDVNLQEMPKQFKKTFLLTRNVFNSSAQFFNLNQEGETLDE